MLYTKCIHASTIDPKVMIICLLLSSLKDRNGLEDPIVFLGCVAGALLGPVTGAASLLGGASLGTLGEEVFEVIFLPGWGGRFPVHV